MIHLGSLFWGWAPEEKPRPLCNLSPLPCTPPMPGHLQAPASTVSPHLSTLEEAGVRVRP